MGVAGFRFSWLVAAQAMGGISKQSIAYKEARERYYWLLPPAVTGIVSQERKASQEQESNELVAILTSIVKKMRAKR
jgi:hypothetical protein